jgi:RNA polymerase sigma-70 factor (ECF subfamily)
MQETSPEIKALILEAKSGNQQAFRQLYDLYAQRIFKYIRLKIQNREEAEDVLQEVFIKTYRGLDSLRLDDLRFSAWLYKVASNTINDHFRKKYRTPEILGIEENFDITDGRSLQKEIEQKSDIETAREVFDLLPPLYKQVLELRFVQDLSLSEIADALGKSNLSIRLVQYRALKKVKLILVKKYADQK